jgi:hypothetical protein
MRPGPNAFVLIAETDGAAMGYAVVQIRGPEETWAFYERLGLTRVLVTYAGAVPD